MAHDWIDEGLRHTGERAGQERLAFEHRRHQTAVIKRTGPEMMRQLLAEVRAVIEEFSQKAARAGDGTLEFEGLPHEGFCVTRTTRPRMGLECRPDYEAHVLYCNMTRTDDDAGDTVETVFSLNFIVDESDKVELRHETRVFRTVEEAVEFLLKPVLFPPIAQRL